MKEVKNKILPFVLFLIASVSYAQERGIKFNDTLTWIDAQNQAKYDKKYLFLDCYTTWCGPCKRMDAESYIAENVGSYFNNNFISIKMQMDTSKTDDAGIVQRYSDARKIMLKYRINAFPTLLFFTPDGQLINRISGYLDSTFLLSVAKEVTDTAFNYTRLKQDYKQNSLDYELMPALAKRALVSGDTLLSKQVIQVYIEQHLLQEPDEKKFIAENVQFLANNIDYSPQSVSFFFKNEKKVDEAVKTRGYAESVIHSYIYKTEIYPSLQKFLKDSTQNPNWEDFILRIKNKYNIHYAKLSVSSAKIGWFGSLHDMPNYTKCISEYVLAYGSNLSNWELNRYAWNIFVYSKDSAVMITARNWMKKVAESESPTSYVAPSYWDTYANLLYKTGDINAALDAEEKALNIAFEYKVNDEIDSFKSTLNKMKKGEPTWTK